MSIAPRPFPPHLSLKGFYVFVSRVRALNRLRVLRRPPANQGGFDHLSDLRHPPELSVWDASYDENGDWSGTLDIFKAGGGEKTAAEFGVPFLGKLPFDPGFVRGGDDGVHRIVSEPEGSSSIAFSEVVAQIQNRVESGSSSSGLEII